jgi:hypothetical protein
MSKRMTCRCSSKTSEVRSRWSWSHSIRAIGPRSISTGRSSWRTILSEKDDRCRVGCLSRFLCASGRREHRKLALGWKTRDRLLDRPRPLGPRHRHRSPHPFPAPGTNAPASRRRGDPQRRLDPRPAKVRLSLLGPEEAAPDDAESSHALLRLTSPRLPRANAAGRSSLFHSVEGLLK